MTKFLLASIILIANVNLNAQFVIDVRSISMGNTATASSYEISALNQNPANIVFQRSKSNASFYFNLVTDVKLQADSKFLSLDFYDNYFAEGVNGNTRALTDEEKQFIYDNAGNQISRFYGSSRLIALLYNSKKAGTFAISIDERFAGNFRVAKDLLQLALFSPVINSQYDFSGTSMNAYWTRQINLSYAKNLASKKNKSFEDLSLGISVKPQFGEYYVETKKSDLLVTTDFLNNITGTGSMEFTYAGVTADNDFKYSLNNAGFGFGFDLGINAAIKNVSRKGKLSFGLSVTDLGYINWNTNTSKYFYDGNFVITDITNKQQIDSVRERIKGTKTPIPSFTVGLPAALRVGAAYKLYDKPRRDTLQLERATFTFDFVQGLTDNLGATKKSVFGVGAEVNIGNVVSPRIGFAFGGEEDFLFSFGLGIDTGPVIIDLGTYNVESAASPKNTSKFSAGLSMKFKVN